MVRWSEAEESRKERAKDSKLSSLSSDKRCMDYHLIFALHSREIPGSASTRTSLLCSAPALQTGKVARVAQKVQSGTAAGAVSEEAGFAAAAAAWILVRRGSRVLTRRPLDRERGRDFPLSSTHDRLASLAFRSTALSPSLDLSRSACTLRARVIETRRIKRREPRRTSITREERRQRARERQLIEGGKEMKMSEKQPFPSSLFLSPESVALISPSQSLALSRSRVLVDDVVAVLLVSHD